jgi:hypothetical protein
VALPTSRPRPPIGFVLLRPSARPVCPNPFSIKHLSPHVALVELALFRTISPPTGYRLLTTDYRLLALFCTIGIWL